MTIRDADIRYFLRRWVRRREGGLIADELALQEGAGRIDLASIRDVLSGYEIKGETDRLNRLEGQLYKYSLVCKKLAVVCTANHYEEVERIAPPWVELIKAVQDGNNRLIFSICRLGGESPNLDAKVIAGLLWKREMLETLAFLKEPARDTLSKNALVKRLLKERSADDLWSLVRVRFLMRAEDPLWAETHLRGVVLKEAG